MPRRRLALTALVALALALAGLVSACSSGSASSTTTKKPRVASTTATPTTSPFGVLKPFDAVGIGQCFDLLPEPRQQPFAVLVIPCTELHSYEVYGLVKYIAGGKPAPAGTSFPGDVVVSNNADEQCIAGFAAFIGVEWPASHYEVQTWWPTQESWSARNDRNIVCAVTKVGGARTKGTAKGIND